MPDSLDDTINELAAAPASTSHDGLTVVERSVGDVIKAEQYRQKVEAVEQPHRGLRFTRLVPPGGA